ncbi:MAG: Ig-like domain repeat protein, partial [Mycobacterium sp.]
MSAAIMPASVDGSTPSGAIRFFDGSMPLPQDPVVANASASIALSLPAVGNHIFAAQYLGDGNFAASAQTSAVATLAVGRADAVLSGPTRPVRFAYGTGGGIRVTLAGQFSGPGISVPTGVVSYTIGGGAAHSVPLVNGAATLVIAAVQPAGSFTLQSTYTGDGNYALSNSVAIALNVAPAHLHVSARRASRGYGADNPVFRGAIHGAVNGDSFTETFSTPATPASNTGRYPIVPAALGSNLANYTVTTRNGVLTIRRAPTTTTVKLPPADAHPRSPVTLTASVTSSTTGTPTGTVVFLDGHVVLGRAQLDAPGTASITTRAGRFGVQRITAFYLGDR